MEYFDDYLVGQTHVSAFYYRLDQVSVSAQLLSIVQNNWSIHHHADVITTLRQLARIEPAWLPI